ncbi:MULTISPECIES: hypothetical protein [Frankia]|uniref:hypothetical protein n=1 Tax=Frankia TaxID=1854 RepID=UPI00187DA219|nr:MULTISPECIES: hypothetical protein [Frankia]
MSIDPPPWFVTWSFTATDGGPALIQAEAFLTSNQIPPATSFVFDKDAADSSSWAVWPVALGQEKLDQPTGPPLLTARPQIAEQFRPGRVFVHLPSPNEDPTIRQPGGTLLEPAIAPEWLIRRLLARLATLPCDPTASQPWETTVDRARVSHDGRELRLCVATDRGEIPAGVDVAEFGDRVEVRVRVGIDRQQPPRPIRIRKVPGTAHGRSARHGGVQRRWWIGVALARPLADRPVFDVGTRDRAAWWAAAWPGRQPSDRPAVTIRRRWSGWRSGVCR